MIVRDEKEREILLEAGRRLRTVLDAVRERIRPGVVTTDLDQMAYQMIIDMGDTPAFLNYRPAGVQDAFPATLCVSLNQEMVHGIPTAEKIVQDGDIISIDCGVEHRGIFVDAAFTMGVSSDARADALIEATRKALRQALAVVRAGATTGDVGNAVETVAREHGYTVPPELGGHGVGAAQHEDPFIPNIGDQNTGERFRAGEVVAIEPIFSEGQDPRITSGDDGFAYCAADSARSAHFEHTVLITEDKPIVVTGPMW